MWSNCALHRETRRRFKEIEEGTQSARSIFHADGASTTHAYGSILSDDAESHFEHALFRSKVYQRVPAPKLQPDPVIESYEEIATEPRTFQPGKDPLTTQDILDLQERCRRWVEMKMNLVWMDANRTGVSDTLRTGTSQQAEATLTGIVDDMET